MRARRTGGRGMPLLGHDVRDDARRRTPRRSSAPGRSRRRVERPAKGSGARELAAEIQGAQLIADHIANSRHGETLEDRLVRMEGALRSQQAMLAESHHRILALLTENDKLRLANERLRADHSEPPEVLHLRAAFDGLQQRNQDLEAALLRARQSAGTVAVATSAERAAAVEYLVDVDPGTAKVAMAMSRGKAAALKLTDETDSPGRGSLPRAAAAERGAGAAQAVVEQHAPQLVATPPKQPRPSDSSSSSGRDRGGSARSVDSMGPSAVVTTARGAGDELGGRQARQQIVAALASGERQGVPEEQEDPEQTARREALAETERKAAAAVAADQRVQQAEEEAQATIELYQAAAAAATAEAAAEVERQRDVALRFAEDERHRQMVERKAAAEAEQSNAEAAAPEEKKSDAQRIADEIRKEGSEAAGATKGTQQQQPVVAWDSNQLEPEPELQPESAADYSPAPLE